MLREYYYDLAKRSAEISGLCAEWIYSQWSHETGDFSSELCRDYNNFGGITTAHPNELELSLGQPDGSLWYKAFASPEDYAEYFGKYLTYYVEDGIYNATNIQEYAEALKHGGYFGDSVENYVNGMTSVYNECFA